MVTLDIAFRNTFLYKVAVQEQLIKIGMQTNKAAKTVIKNTDFVFESFETMEMPIDVAKCII